MKHPSQGMQGLIGDWQLSGGTYPVDPAEFGETQKQILPSRREPDLRGFVAPALEQGGDGFEAETFKNAHWVRCVRRLVDLRWTYHRTFGRYIDKSIAAPAIFFISNRHGEKSPIESARLTREYNCRR